jgi:hypothetical protein
MKKIIRVLHDFTRNNNHTVSSKSVSDVTVSRTTKNTTNTVVMSFDTGEELSKETSSFRYLYLDYKWRG